MPQQEIQKKKTRNELLDEIAPKLGITTFEKQRKFCDIIDELSYDASKGFRGNEALPALLELTDAKISEEEKIRLLEEFENKIIDLGEDALLEAHQEEDEMAQNQEYKKGLKQ